jgi:hypothetical protein
MLGAMKLRIIACVAGVCTLACSEPIAAPHSSPETICEAAKRAVGSVVAIRAEFDGFAYDTNSRHVTLVSAQLCSSRGASSAFVELATDEQRSKLMNASPRGKRQRRPGTIVTLTGRITKVEDGRFVYLDRGSVQQVGGQ